MIWQNGGPDTDDHLAFSGHEPELVQHVARLLEAQTDAVFLDVGAHVGLYSVNLAKYCQAVISIEANPDTYETLRTNIVDNGLTNVIPVNVAAWDEPSTLYLFDPNGKIHGGSTQCHEEADGLGGQGVLADRLDTVVAATTSLQPTFVKIDVEGAEAHVLRGMSTILTTAKPYLFIEMHDVYLGKPEIREQVEEVLWDHNYIVDDTLIHGGQYYFRAWPQ